MIDLASLAWNLAVLAPVGVFSALLCVGLIAVLAPWLKANALARPNSRSSHRQATPQGGGAAVIVATFAAAWAGAALTHAFGAGDIGQFLALTGAAALLAAIGAVDDIRGLGPVPRLIVQCAAIALVLAALPAELRVVPMAPWLIERATLFVGCVWFVNLANFMDGIDWMTVAEFVPVTGALVVFGLLGEMATLPALIALALFGAILGFAPFNKPVAKLFLGDVGSLPLGLVLAWLLLYLAARGHLAAALLLPLYYLADASLTLGRRVLAGAPIWQAHRTHFYQRAADRGFTVTQVVARVFLVNLGLAALAFATVARPGPAVATPALAAGAALVGWLLWHFSRERAP